MSHYYFWLNSNLHPDSSEFNIPAIFNISGSLDITALEKSISHIIERHDVLRMSFPDHNRAPDIHIQDSLELTLHQTDLRDERQDKVEEFIQKEIVRPFDLSQAPLLRANLLLLDQEEYVLILVFHHIITDLRSKEILGEELSHCYSSLAKHEPIPPLRPAIPYAQQIKREEEWKKSQNARDMLDFWVNEIKDYDGLLELPLDKPRPPTAGSNGNAHYFKVESEQAQVFNDFCRENTIAPFVGLLSCYLVLLSRYSRQKELIIGVPLSNRRVAESKDCVGCFVNIVPLAFTLNENMTLRETLALVRKKLLLAHRHQETSFHDIVTAVKPQRDPSYNPIFQVGYTLEPPMQLTLSGLTIESRKVHNQGAQLDIFLNLFEITPTIQGYFEFNTDLFEGETIARLSGHYSNLLKTFHKQADVAYDKAKLLSEFDRNKLLMQWNNTTRDYGEPLCLDQLFAHQVEKTPNNVAISFDYTLLTYRELDERANQVAHYLKNNGIGANDIVGIFMERSLEMVIAIYGIIKAGGAYLPLEPELPDQRLSFILEETKAKVVLTQEAQQDNLPAFKGVSMSLDSGWSEIAVNPTAAVARSATPDSLAYVIYTSGSTGTPKGVMNEHRGIFNRIMWMQEAYQLNEGHQVLQKTPFSFDVSVWEFFWPLFTGATLIIAPPNLHKDPKKLSDFIQEQQITTLHFVPSMLRLFLDVDEAANCQSLQQVFCSGEELSWALRTKFFEKFSCELHNLYGPTEAAVDVSYWPCKKDDSLEKIPIGFPVANTQLYILDDYLQPVPQGVTGELFIGGVQVARGYLEREELNTYRFIKDPFSSHSDGHLYRTGDLARYLNNGAIEYLGRVDFQVKIFGNRIELSEIEASLRRHPAIDDAVVTLYDKGDEKQILAYILTDASTTQELDLRKFLLELLPYYMIPSHFVAMKEFPLNMSGKIDRKQLPEPKEEPVVASVPTSSFPADDDIESTLTEMWQEILENDDIDTDSNFFDAGGNSLLASKLAFDLEQKLGFAVALVKIFQYPTVEALADFLEEEQEKHC